MLIIEGDGHPVPLGAPGHEAHPEHGAPRGLHPGRDVVPGLGAHQDLEVTLSSLRGVHCYERVTISDTCGGHEDMGGCQLCVLLADSIVPHAIIASQTFQGNMKNFVNNDCHIATINHYDIC